MYALLAVVAAAAAVSALSGAASLFAVSLFALKTSFVFSTSEKEKLKGKQKVDQHDHDLKKPLHYEHIKVERGGGLRQALHGV